MGDYILLDSPMIENAVKITANVKTTPRRFGRSSLKDTPVVSGGTSDEYNGFFKLSLVTDEEDSSGYRVVIADGAYGGRSEARVNNQKFNIAPYTSRTYHLPNNILGDFETVYFYLYFDPDKMTDTDDKILTIKESDYSPYSDRSILLGRLYYDYKAGKLRVIQDSYGTPFLPYFYSCKVTPNE